MEREEGISKIEKYLNVHNLRLKSIKWDKITN